MSKFKVGDHVVLRDDCNIDKYAATKKGQVYIVTEVEDEIEFIRLNNYYWYESSNFIPIGEAFALNEPTEYQTPLKVQGSSEFPVGSSEISSESSPNEQGGIKHDKGKLRYTLLLQDLPRAVKEVTEVLEFGSKKYQRLNFEKVESHRYDEAICRHLMSYLSGEITDPESDKNHLAHLVCCALFLIERELKAGELNGKT